MAALIPVAAQAAGRAGRKAADTLIELGQTQVIGYSKTKYSKRSVETLSASVRAWEIAAVIGAIAAYEYVMAVEQVMTGAAQDVTGLGKTLSKTNGVVTGPESPLAPLSGPRLGPTP